MSFDADYIEKIVRGVLDEMRSRQTTVSTSAPKNQEPTVVASGGQLVITERVISESVLVGVSAAGRTISLVPGAVITPSGRDYIRKHNVTLSSSVAGKVRSGSGLIVDLQSSSALSSAAAVSGWKIVSAGNLFDAAAVVAKESASRTVVCVGNEAAAVGCLVNRDVRVRAAVVGRPDSIAALVSIMNPNVWCVEGTGWSFSDFQRLLKSVSGSTEKPVSWEEVFAGGHQ